MKCDQLPHLHHGHKPVLQQETVGQHAQVWSIAQGHAGGLPGHQGRILPVQLFLKFRQDLPGVRHHLGGAGIARAQILHQPNGGVILPALAQGALQGEAQPQGCAQQRHQQRHQQQKCHRPFGGPQGVSDTVSGKHMSFPPSLSMYSVYTDAPGYGVSAGVVRRIVQQQGLAHPPEGGALTPVGAEHRHGGQRIGLIRVVQGHVLPDSCRHENHMYFQNSD